MQKFLVGGKRVLESSGPSPAEPPRKVLVQQANHPPEDTKYVCRQQSSGKDKLDTPFKVARWGAVGRDIISSAGDIIPDGFRVKRTLKFVRSSSLFSFSEVLTEVEEATEDSPVIVKLKRGPAKGSTLEETVYFQTRFDVRTGNIQYAVKAGLASQFEDSFWKPSPTVACRDFLERSGFETDKSLVGPKLFGFQCDAVQEHLVSMREPQPEAAQALELKTRGAMERDPLKAVVGRLAASVKESLTGSASSSASFSLAQASSSDDIKVFPVSACEPVCAHSVNFDLIKRSVCLLKGFAYTAVQHVVGNMLHQLSDALIAGREPERRLVAILRQLLAQPDIKTTLNLIAMQQLGLQKKELSVVKHVLEQMRLAITVHKNKRDRESSRLYQILLNIVSSPPAARLQRATARLFGLCSRQGLAAAQCRVASQLVDDEGGILVRPANLFYPSDRIERSDWQAGEQMRDNAKAYWAAATRVTSCTKHVVCMENGEQHPVHYLEDTVPNFYQAFLKSGRTFDPLAPNTPTFAVGGHFYATQLLVRKVPEGTTSGSVRAAFAQWRPARVNAMAQGTFFYVVFSSAAECQIALLAASSHNFSLAPAKSTLRPLMGSTAFANGKTVKAEECMM